MILKFLNGRSRGREETTFELMTIYFNTIINYQRFQTSELLG